MSLIDKSYFVGEIALPNLEKVINTFNSSLDKYEGEILTDLLGYELYKEFKEALAAAPVIPLPQKFVDLRDGVEFTFDYNGKDITVKWNGLVNAEKESLIAYYTYYKIRQKELSITTSVNEARGKLENSESVNEARKMLNAWRRMLQLYGSVQYSESGVKYGNVWYGHDYFYFDKYDPVYDTFNDLPSAFNFLNTFREADYPNWLFSPHRDMNEFGL